MRGWIQTDGSVETMQYGKKIDKYIWLYREVEETYKSEEEALSDFENWHEEEVNILDYSKEKLRDIVSSYGYSMNDNYILEQSGETFSEPESIQLIAECVFEYNHYY